MSVRIGKNLSTLPDEEIEDRVKIAWQDVTLISALFTPALISANDLVSMAESLSMASTLPDEAWMEVDGDSESEDVTVWCAPIMDSIDNPVVRAFLIKSILDETPHYTILMAQAVDDNDLRMLLRAHLYLKKARS